MPARVKDKVHDTQQNVQVKAEEAMQQVLYWRAPKHSSTGQARWHGKPIAWFSRHWRSSRRRWLSASSR